MIRNKSAALFFFVPRCVVRINAINGSIKMIDPLVERNKLARLMTVLVFFLL